MSWFGGPEVTDLQALYRHLREVTKTEFIAMECWLDEIDENWRETVCTFTMIPERSVYHRFATDFNFTRNCHSVSAIARTTAVH